MIDKSNFQEIMKVNKIIDKKIKTLVSKDKSLFFDKNISYLDKIKIKLEETVSMIKYPLNNKSIGGFIYKTKNNTYCFINSSQNRCYQNFVLLHEFYHLIYGDHELEQHVVYLDEWNEVNQEERKASYYASLMLLDDDSLRSHYYKFSEKNDDFKEIICLLIDLFKVPTKALIIRLYELNCLSNINFDLILQLMDKKNDDYLLPIFTRLGLDTSILQSSNIIKFDNIIQEFEYASKQKTMLETFLHENKKYYNRLLQQLKENNDEFAK